MRRKTFLSGIASLALCALACASTGAARAADGTTTRAIDAAKSKAQFSIQHIFVDRVTGTVPILNGAVELPANGVVPTHVDAVLDPSRIHTDEPDRDASLESSDYFDAKAFPTWTFESTRIARTGPQTFEMDGTLTIHGIGQPERFAVTIAGTPDDPIYHATVTIDRHAFGMKGTRLDPVIGNAADVTLDIVLK